MSSESEIVEQSEGSSTLRRTVRTVTPGYRGRPNTEMNAIGLGYATLLAILLLPLLPFAVLLWLGWRIASLIRPSSGEANVGPGGTVRRRRGRAS